MASLLMYSLYRAVFNGCNIRVSKYGGTKLIYPEKMSDKELKDEIGLTQVQFLDFGKRHVKKIFFCNIA